MSVYVSSDWHGSPIGFQVLNSLKNDDTLYFLGDAIDRGPASYELLTALLADPRVIFIKGNHEQMMYEYLSDILTEKMRIRDDWIMNGGNKTLDTLMRKMENNPREMIEIIAKIRDLPTEITYYPRYWDGEIILEHAGYTPGLQHRSHDPLWDRSHFYDEWSKDKKYDYTFVIHGHTPTMYLRLDYGYNGMEPLTEVEMQHKHDWWREENKKIIVPEVIHYCDNHKIDIDLCTIVSNKIALFNLETFEVQYFKGEE